MTLPVRVEKLLFIVDELQMTRLLADHAPDAATARMVARHILVRAKDFIDHARALKKPLQQAGHATADFHTAKEIYAGEFDCFLTMRHRMSAHVQDLSLEDRITLWSNIETSKIDYFVDGAREIYDGLGSLGIAGFVPFTPPPELTDAAVLGALKGWRDETPRPAGPEFASDALSLSRPDTVSMLNGTPVHERAAQLALLRRWIRSERALLCLLEPFVRVRRIVKARLLTDIVSFTDCLVTRPTTPLAPQAMTGLDDLIRAQGEPATPIENFLVSFDLDAFMAALRPVRNRMGGHLDSDPATGIPDLIRQIDAYPASDALAFHERQEAIFRKACLGVLWLADYAADGMRVRGVTGLAPRPARKPYDPARAEVDGEWPLPALDRAGFDGAVAAWNAAQSPDREDALDWFRAAEQQSPVVEVLDREETSGSNWRRHRIELRTVHLWLVEALAAAADDEAESSLLQLIATLGRRGSNALTEVLIAYTHRRLPMHRPMMIQALGETAPWWHPLVRAYLEDEIATDHPRLGVWVRTAIMRMFVRSQISPRANREVGAEDWAPIENELLEVLSPDQKLLTQLVLYSQFNDPGLAVNNAWFETDLVRLREEIRSGLERISDTSIFATRQSVLGNLLDAGDIAGVAVLLFTELAPDDTSGVISDLLWAICNGPAITPSREDATRHMALCYDKIDDSRAALDIMTWLSERKPDSIDYRLLKLELEAGLGETPANVRTELAFIRSTYRLSDDHHARADHIAGQLPVVAAEEYTP